MIAYVIFLAVWSKNELSIALIIEIFFLNPYLKTISAFLFALDMYQKCLGTVQEAKLDVIIGKQKIDPFLF